jgi:hypothetical protein
VKRMMGPERIVADGERRLRRSAEFRAACDEIVRTVQQENAFELERVGPARRLLLRTRMRRQVRARIEQLAPKDALYLSD